MLLRDEGFVAVEAANGKVALDYLVSAPATPDLILVDLNMPMMSGRELLQILKGNLRFAKIPIVVVTSELSPRDLPNETIAGWLSKPFLIAELVALVRKHAPARKAAVGVTHRRVEDVEVCP